MLSFAKSRRLAYVAKLHRRLSGNGACRLEPLRGHRRAQAIPGGFDEKAEIELLLQDLRDEIDGFDQHARILNIAVTRDGWPPQRAVAGFDLPRDTPFEGLWNVGDAVKEYATEAPPPAPRRPNWSSMRSCRRTR